MKRKSFVTGMMSPLARNMRSKKVTTLGAAITIASVALGVWSCGGSRDDEDSMRDSVVSQPPVAADDFDDDEDAFAANNDIAMTLRSVADAINVGESIDSLDYSFKGVLTDGSGMPLFTDVDGLPGEWEVEVVSPSVVRIRNVNTGDLISDDLVGYISAAMQLDDDDTLQLVSERESANRKVAVFSFGKGTLTIETEYNDDSESDSGDKMLITMRADHKVQNPVMASDTTAGSRSSGASASSVTESVRSAATTAGGNHGKAVKGYVGAGQ